MRPRPTNIETLAAIKAACADGAVPSMRCLAAAAGVSESTIYRLVGSRAALLAELGLDDAPDVRERILRTAADLVADLGPQALNVDGVVAASGVSRASVYRLFPTRGDLIAGLVDSLTAIPDPEGTLAQLTAGDPDQMVRQFATWSLGYSSRSMTVMYRLLLAGISERDTDVVARDVVGRQVAELGQVFVRYLEDQMAAGRLRRVDPVVAMHSLIGPIIHHLLLRPVLAEHLHHARPVEDLIDEMTDLWLHAMRPG